MDRMISAGEFLEVLESTGNKEKSLSLLKKNLTKDSIIISFVNSNDNIDRFSYDCILGARVKEVLNSLFVYKKMLPYGVLHLSKSKNIYQKQYRLSRLKLKKIFVKKFLEYKLLFIFVRGDKEDRIIIILSKEKIEPVDSNIIGITKALFVFNKLNEIEQLYKSDVKMYSKYINNLEKKLHLINYIANSLMSTLSLEKIFSMLSNLISKEIGFKMVLVNMLSNDGKTLERVAAAGIPDAIFNQLKRKKIPLKNIKYLLKGKYKLSNFIYFIRDISQTQAAEYSAVIDNKPGNFAEDRNRWRNDDTILIPIYDRVKNLIGTISLDGPNDGKIPDSKTLELLEIISQFAALAIRNAFLYKKTNDTTAKLTKAYKITSFISKIMAIDDLVRNLTIMLRNNFEYLNVVILKADKEVLKVFYASDYTDKEKHMIDEMLLKTDISVTKRCWLDRKHYLIKDSRRATDFISIRNSVVSEIAIPIIVHNETWGVLNVEKEGANSLDEQDLNLLEIIVHHLSGAIENANLYRELNKMANTDPMTGLYNYRFLKNYLGELINKNMNYKKCFSLVMLDMNNFKGINDTYGHLAGDEVLKWLSVKLISILGEYSKVTRYGGDEFLIIMEKSKSKAKKIIEKFRDNIRTNPFEYNGTKINVDFAMGIKEYPADENEMFKLIDKVDKALYKDKHRV